MASQSASGGASFSLFPNPNFSKPMPRPRQTSRTRRSESRERRAVTPQSQLQDSRAATPGASSSPVLAPVSSPQNGRQTPQQRAHTPLDINYPLEAVSEAALDHHNPPSTANVEEQPLDTPGADSSPPRLTLEIPRQANASILPPQILAGGSNNPPRNYIAKPLLLFDQPPSFAPPPTAPPAMRSMFPTYNPELPLDQQTYGPTQLQPSGMPRAVVSRQSYFEDPETASERPPVRSPPFRVPTRPQNPPIIPPISTTEQLQDLWKVTNGWQASGSEGRVYCLKLTQQKDAPVYTLSSASQPFYSLRLDPTSASAYVSLSRHDPSKIYKAPKSSSGSPASIFNGVRSGNNRASDNKYWQEALTTTLEEESRKHSPNDGLAALLMPCAATKIVLDRADDPVTVAAAERECGRLVWDDDSASHYLVHPALATPFCITIENCAAWSRVEYTLEHHESPQHLAKLTRDGTGTGWLEIDTGVASKIESFYVVDVAVTALLLVAAMEDRNSPRTVIEAFEAPPVPEPPRQSRSLSSALSRHRDDDGSKKSKKDRKDKKRQRMEQFEIDIESQDDSLGKGSKKAEAEDKLPFLIRVIVKLGKGLFSCFIWILTMGFACVKGVFKVFYKCVGSKY